MWKEKWKTFSKKKTVMVAALFFLILMAFIFAAFFLTRPAPVEAYRVTEKPYAEKIIAVGQLGLEQETTLVAEVNGTVKNVSIKEGDILSSGLLLIEIENQVTLESESAQSEYNRLSLLTSSTRLDYDNAQILYREGALSRTELNNKKMAYETALSQMKAAQLQLQIAQDNMGKYQIRIPWDSVLLKAYVEPGDYVRIGDSLAEIGSVGNYRILAELDEKYYPIVEKGMPVTISVGEGHMGETRGEISSITPQINPNTGTFEIKIQVPSGFPYLASNLTVNLEILLVEKENALVIPQNFLLSEGKTAGKGQGFVLRYEEGLARKIPVEIDSGFGSNVLITKGLQNGNLLLSPATGLIDGDRVHRYQEGESN
jgi:membrane fusion protein (multidrug efflux system)